MIKLTIHDVFTLKDIKTFFIKQGMTIEKVKKQG